MEKNLEVLILLRSDMVIALSIEIKIRSQNNKIYFSRNELKVIIFRRVYYNGKDHRSRYLRSCY